jgi:hypothetical protein
VSEQKDDALAVVAARAFSEMSPLAQVRLLNALITTRCVLSSEPETTLALIHGNAREHLANARDRLAQHALATTPPAGNA